MNLTQLLDALRAQVGSYQIALPGRQASVRDICDEIASGWSALSDADIAQIVEGIDLFIIEGDEPVRKCWQPYIDKLNAMKRGDTVAR